MTPFARLCLASFAMDMAMYLTMTGVPWRALALGADAFTLGFLPAAYALPYSLTVLWAGGHIDRGERLRTARASLLVTTAAVVSLAFANRMAWIFAAPAVMGATIAFFWPAVQATFADLAAGPRGGSTVAANIGWYNTSWSLGKGTGFLFGGMILVALGFRGLFAAAAVAVLGVHLLIRGLPAPRPGTAESAASLPLPEGGDGPPEAVQKRFRLAAWTANSLAYGAVAVLNHHYPRLLAEWGGDARIFGTYLGLIFFSQTATFLLMIRWRGWHFRALPLLLAQIPLYAALALLPGLRHAWAILATAPAAGYALGTMYFASLYYSVGGRTRRGRFAGIHEGTLGLGSVIVPILGGVAVRLSGGDLAWPYWIAAALGGGGLLVQLGLLVRPRPGR